MILIQNNEKHLYHAYGLNIESTLVCPELPSGAPPAEVSVRFGPVPNSLTDAKGGGLFFQTAPNRLLQHVEHIAGYLVSNGREIVVDPVNGVDEDSVRLFLIDNAFGAILHQRGFLVLHGAAVKTDKGCIALLGSTGCGKSTLAEIFRNRGRRILTDDVMPVFFDRDNNPVVQPSYPFIKLWADALNRQGKPIESYRRLRPEMQKYAVPLGDCFSSDPAPLIRIYSLAVTNHDRFKFEAVHGVDKLELLKFNTYRFFFLKGMGLVRNHFDMCAAIARKIKVIRATRPATGFNLETLADRMEAEW